MVCLKLSINRTLTVDKSNNDLGTLRIHNNLPNPYYWTYYSRSQAKRVAGSLANPGLWPDFVFFPTVEKVQTPAFVAIEFSRVRRPEIPPARPLRLAAEICVGRQGPGCANNCIAAASIQADHVGEIG